MHFPTHSQIGFSTTLRTETFLIDYTLRQTFTTYVSDKRLERGKEGRDKGKGKGKQAGRTESFSRGPGLEDSARRSHEYECGNADGDPVAALRGVKTQQSRTGGALTWNAKMGESDEPTMGVQFSLR